ncbi:UNVERIFIED_CONTAM: Retrovirus-related Pol polyprotein from transposon TNT 1-94 [Sesamum radiatum]|uniref:Retrovirus-related Pol polyprotein from transposon TNT 1-94 n=1 Tax=Sesamum radiatum TaxID=300843 RepID=A0AAW2KRP6_SESRA
MSVGGKLLNRISCTRRQPDLGCCNTFPICETSWQQKNGLKYDKTIAPVTKMTTAHTTLVLAASQSWPLLQMDVRNAFLHSDLKEEVSFLWFDASTESMTETVVEIQKLLHSAHPLLGVTGAS